MRSFFQQCLKQNGNALFFGSFQNTVLSDHFRFVSVQVKNLGMLNALLDAGMITQKDYDVMKEHLNGL